MSAKKYVMTDEDFKFRIKDMAAALGNFDSCTNNAKFYGVPRGGIPIACELAHELRGQVTYDADLATVIVDDIIDSGDTKSYYDKAYPHTPFFALIDNKHAVRGNPDWIVFPWERHEGLTGGVEDNVTRLLQYIGEDPKREGILETPKRFVKYLSEVTEGYAQDPSEHLKLFTEETNHYDQLIVLEDIPYYSMCEHHLAPFFGYATIAYIPGSKIIGLSKIARVVNVFARRLQVQERLTEEIANFLNTGLQDAVGVGVSLNGRHFCMESRGVKSHSVNTTTTALYGALRDDAAARNEFLATARNRRRP